MSVTQANHSGTENFDLLQKLDSSPSRPSYYF